MCNSVLNDQTNEKRKYIIFRHFKQKRESEKNKKQKSRANNCSAPFGICVGGLHISLELQTQLHTHRDIYSDDSLCNSIMNRIRFCFQITIIETLIYDFIYSILGQRDTHNGSVSYWNGEKWHFLSIGIDFCCFILFVFKKCSKATLMIKMHTWIFVWHSISFTRSHWRVLLFFFCVCVLVRVSFSINK